MMHGMDGPARLVARGGRVIVEWGSASYDVTEAELKQIQIHRPTVDVTGIGDPYTTQVGTGYVEVTLDLIVPDERDHGSQPWQTTPTEPAEEPTGAAEAPRRLQVPVDDQRRSRRILGPRGGDQ